MWINILHLWEINEYGTVRNKKNKYILRHRFRSDGYVDIKLGYKRYLLHRLVALAFIPNPSNLAQVNHKDGIRSNFAVNNLEWVDQFANMQHAISAGLFPSRKGTKNGRSSISEELAIKIKTLLKAGKSNIVVSRELNVKYGIVANIKNNQSWRWLKV